MAPEQKKLMKKAKRDPDALFNPDVYREQCPFERSGETPWVWCFSCQTIFQFGWYVWEDSSFTKYVNGGWNNGDCLCPVKGCASDFLKHWWINADGSRADTGSDFITVPFEEWDMVDPHEFKLVG
jgi:hypothetical protein